MAQRVEELEAWEAHSLRLLSERHEHLQHTHISSNNSSSNINAAQESGHTEMGEGNAEGAVGLDGEQQGRLAVGTATDSPSRQSLMTTVHQQLVLLAEMDAEQAGYAVYHRPMHV